MSIEHLAELLHVDEVRIEHGPKGYGLSVRLDRDWMSTTIDHDDLKKSVNGHHRPKMHGVAEKLVSLTDTLLHGVSRAEIAKAIPAPIRQVVPQQEYQDFGRQRIRFSGGPPAPYEPPAALAQAPAASTSMASRFHAIVAELEKL